MKLEHCSGVEVNEDTKYVKNVFFFVYRFTLIVGQNARQNVDERAARNLKSLKIIFEYFNKKENISANLDNINENVDGSIDSKHEVVHS